MATAYLGLIMPTRNVEGMVIKILKQIEKDQWSYIQKLVIIDNGSFDKTLVEVYNFIQNSGYGSKIFVQENLKDLGYGYSINCGLNLLVEEKDVMSIGIIHADDQFSSKELLDLYRLRNFLNPSDVLLINRIHDSVNSSSWRQRGRNFGNLIISLFGRLSTGKKMKDFNTPFFLVSKSSARELLLKFNFGNDIYFHPRINLIFATLCQLHFDKIKWKRATKTTKIPIIRMGLKILKVYIMFGWYFRVKKVGIDESYKLASNL